MFQKFTLYKIVVEQPLSIGQSPSCPDPRIAKLIFNRSSVVYTVFTCVQVNLVYKSTPEFGSSKQGINFNLTF